LIGIAAARATSGDSIMSNDVRFFAGIDWATETHQVCLIEAEGGKIIGERAFAHGGEGLAELCDWLASTSGAEPPMIAVAIEAPHGPVVEILLERRFQVDAVNPKQLDRFRDRFTVAGAKDDRRDAYVLADALRTDRHCFRRLAVEDPIVIELREWSRMAEDLQQERNRLGNRVREQLWRYYPQALELGDDLAADWFLELWALAPTPAKAAHLRESRVTGLLKAHRIRRIETAEVLRILGQKPLVVAGGTVEAAIAHITAVAARLKLVNQQIKQAHRQLDELSDKLAESREEDAPGQKSEQHDVTILRSLPGVGRIVLATLLGEAAEPLRKRDYHALRTLSGVAPVTRRSGKRCVVLMRQACHLRLRTAVYHWARVAIQHDARSRARYAELRKRGHSHGRALRSVADRLLAVACAMLKTQTTFKSAICS
jgi:transposase